MKPRFETPMMGKEVPIGRRQMVRVPFTCRLTELQDEIDGISEVALVIDLVGDVLGVVSVTFTAVEGREVTSAAMREIAVNNVMKNAVARVMQPMEQLPGGITKITHPSESWGFSDEEREHFRALGPVAETLEAVAEVYEFGRMTGRPPAREVERQLGVPRTTASKWVRRARDEGHLGG